MSEDNYKVCFIIALKYYRNYETYIKYYLDNIQKYYENSFVIIVDNNSKYIQDIHEMFKTYKNLTIITNDDACKFEIGAYKVGINYLISNNLTCDYCIFTQDTFILKNKYNFNNLKNSNTLACTINSYHNSRFDICYYTTEISRKVLSSLNLQNSIDKLSLCYSNSFVLHHSKIMDFYNIVKDLIITVRHDSILGERFLSGILYHLNNHIITDIDGDIHIIKIYDGFTVNVYDDIPGCFFVKKLQQKNENTVDI